jgi:catechol 2,3-dioxygenase-like lactoylglutathione lyase family enzyme
MKWTANCGLALASLLLCATLTAGATPRQQGETPPAVEAQPFFFALSVADVDASAAWYERVFGFAVVSNRDLPEREIRIRLLQRPGAFLELVDDAAARPLTEAAPSAARRSLAHGVFKIGLLSADLDRTLERLSALGVPLRGIVFTEADGSMRSLQVEDPDGNVVQVFELLGD